MKQIRDAVVIGSGIIGSATSFAMVRGGIRRVTLLEKGPLTSGMTRRNAGLVHPFQAQPLLAELAAVSHDFYKQWGVHLRGKSAFVETGAAAIAMSDIDVPNALAAFAVWKEHLPDANEMMPGALSAVFPGVANNLGAAMFTPRAGYADAVLTAQAMANSAADRGLEIKTGTQVKQILVEQGRVKGVTTTTGDIEAPLVIVAAGSWSERLLAPLGITLHLRYRRGSLVFYEQPPETSQELPLLLDVAGQYFLRPHPYHMAAAGMVALAPQMQGVESLDEFVTNGDSASVKWFAERCVPSLAAAPPKRAHSIAYDMPKDELPALGPVTNVHGLYVAAGFGTSAFSVAPQVGEIIARLLIDGTIGHDISSLSPMRPTLRNP